MNTTEKHTIDFTHEHLRNWVSENTFLKNITFLGVTLGFFEVKKSLRPTCFFFFKGKSNVVWEKTRKTRQKHRGTGVVLLEILLHVFVSKIDTKVEDTKRLKQLPKKTTIVQKIQRYFDCVELHVSC